MGRRSRKKQAKKKNKNNGKKQNIAQPINTEITDKAFGAESDQAENPDNENLAPMELSGLETNALFLKVNADALKNSENMNPDLKEIFQDMVGKDPAALDDYLNPS